MDNHRNLLFLLLKSLVLRKMLSILRLEALKYFSFLKLTRIDLHELLHCIKLVLHGHSSVHDRLLSLADLLELIELVFDDLYCRVLINLSCIGGLWDHCCKLLASFSKHRESLLILLKLGLELLIGGHSHLHLSLVLGQAILVLLVDSGRRRSVELGTVLCTQVSIVRFLIVQSFLASCEHISVDLLQALGLLDT